MKHGEWLDPGSEWTTTRTVWLGPDTQRAWAYFCDHHADMARKLVHTSSPVRCDSYPVKAAAFMCPDFVKFCAIPADELEALRAIAGVGTYQWAIFTSALTWQELNVTL